MLSAEQELARAVPVVAAVRAALGPSALISIDTFYASVAAAAVAAGANMVNDVTGGKGDAGMAPLLARLGVPYVCMHSRGIEGPAGGSSSSARESPAGGSTVYSGGGGGGADGSSSSSSSSSSSGSAAATAAAAAGGDLEPRAVVREVGAWLSARAGALEAAGVPRWAVVVDPGLGFSKRPVHSFALLGASAAALCSARYPVLVGASRKGFLGAATGVSDPRARAWGTAAAVTAAIASGADVVRVHDVAEMAQVCRVADAIYRGFVER